MSRTIKVREQKEPRNLVVRDMILNTKGGPMRDRRNRRPKDARRDPIKNWEEA